MASKLEMLQELERRGTLPQEYRSALDEARNRGLIPPVEAPGILDRAGATVRMLNRGAALNVGDNIAAAIPGVVSAIKGEGFGTGYNRAMDKFGRIEARDAQVAGTPGEVANVVGQMGTGASLTPSSLMQAPTMLGRAWKAALAAAPVSGVANVGQQNPRTPGGLLGDFSMGAGVGAATAGVASPVFEGIAAGARGVMNMLRPNVDNMARQQVAQALTRDAMSIDDVRSAVTGAGGKPVTIADIGGENTKNLVKAISRQPGAARNTVRNFLNDRQATQSGRIADDVAGAFGGRGDFYGSMDDIIAQREAAAKPAYKKAYEYGGNLLDDPEIRDIYQRPFFKDAMRVAVRESQITGEPLPKSITLTPEGDIQIGDFLDMRTADLAKRGMDSLYRNYSRSADNASLAPAITRARGQYVSALDRLNPAYGEARAAFAGPASSADALELGREALKQDPEVIARTVAGLKGGDAEFYREGMRRAVTDIMRKTPDGSDVARRIAGTPQIREQLRAALGDKADDLLKNIETEAQMYGTRRVATGGSDTAENLANSSDLEGATRDIVNGNQFNMAARFLNYLKQTTQSANQPLVNERIGQVLLTPQMTTAPVYEDILAQQEREMMQRALMARAAQPSGLLGTNLISGGRNGN